MPTFLHDGLAFHYRDSGTGYPFVFQHGLGADSSQPFGLVNPPPGFRLLAVDCRGHGETRPLGDARKLRLGVFGDDVVAWMNHLEVRAAVIGGISMGAAVALNLALRYPHKATGLILSRPAWLEEPNPFNVKMFSLIARLLREFGAQRGLEVFRQTPEFQATLRQWPDTANSFARQFESPRAEESAQKFELIVNDTPSRDRQSWRRICVPTLILANRHDPIHPFEYGEELARSISGARFREVVSKSISLERHHAGVQQAVVEFLTSHFNLTPC